MSGPRPSRTFDLTPEHVERFWQRVDRKGANECWIWKGERRADGYAVYRWMGGQKKFYAHRLSLLIAGVDITNLVVRHDCDNPPCVNPNHLRTGTQADNIRDAVSRRRMDMTGLTLGWNWTYPPRPCERCGTALPESRRRFCPPCRSVRNQESRLRYEARMLAR